MKKQAIKFFVTLLCLLCLCASCSVVAASPQQSVDYKMLSTAQWEALKQTQQSLELKLEEAKTQSLRVKKLSKELRQKLEAAEKSLIQSKLELANSNASLEKLKLSLEEVRKLLNELTQQISVERKKQEDIKRRMKLQQFGWFVLGMVIGSK